MKSRSFRVLIALFAMIACGYFAFTRRYQIEAKIWHMRHGYWMKIGELSVPVPEHWLIMYQSSIAIMMMNTAPAWHRDGKLHTAPSITLFPSFIRPVRSGSTDLWLSSKRQQLERDGVRSIEEKRFAFDTDTLVCIGGSEMRDIILRGRTNVPNTDIVTLECLSEGGLSILFQGEPSDLESFSTLVTQIQRQN
jgi:hypothetical protein